MRKVLVILVLAIFSGCAQTAEKNISKTALLISNVNIVDVRSGSIHEKQQVVIDSGIIKRISKTVATPEGYSTVIDGSEKYLSPGLAEMHAHIPPPTTDSLRIQETLFLYLSNGVTTIRGMLGDPAHLLLRKNAAEGAILSPRIFTSSPSLNGNSVTSKEQAKEKVTEYQNAGYDFLKIHPGIQRDVFDQVVRTANEVGIPFAGHVPVAVGIRHALKSKYASIDHVDGFLEGLVPGSANVLASENGFFGYNFTALTDLEKVDELVAMAKANKVCIVATQSLFERWFAPVSADDLLKQPEMTYMPASTLANWKERKNASTEESTRFTEKKWNNFTHIRRTLIKALQENGHGMLLGSDAPQLFNVPGFSIHHEIDGMEAAGLTPLQILQSGTLNPARYFGMEAEFGSVAEGLAADLLLLESNPLEDLDALKQLSGVMVKGKWLSKETIDGKLKEIAKNAAKN